ncbi:putative reverse transcriptase domain-containing protein, partial [Tanacetum coccineum]
AKILEAQGEASKDLKAPVEWPRGLETHFERRDDVHPGADKMYYDLRDLYWWPGMKRDIAEYQALQKALGKKLNMSTTYHPEIDGQSEHTIQTPEHMLYHKSIKCAPFEALYGRKCRSPVIWAEVGESQLIRPEIVQETIEKIVQIKERLKTTRSRQKIYADKRRKPLEFKFGVRVLLKVSPWKGVVRFGNKGKLAPRYVRPFEIVECVRPIDENMHFVEEPIEIVERDVKKLKRRRIPLVKVRWNSRQGAEYTWDLVCSRHMNSGDQSSLRGIDCEISSFQNFEVFGLRKGKKVKADDQAIETILMGLPEDIYAETDSCNIAKEIWLRVQQMMKGTDIGVHEKEVMLLNELERFTSVEGESIESYYHHFAKLMNDLDGNQPTLKNIAYQPSNITYMQHLQPNNNYVQQPPFNMNYMQQPMEHLKDILDLIIAMNMALVLMAKAFKLSYTTPTNNNQRISSNPRNRQTAQPGMHMGQERLMKMVGGNGGNQFRQYAGQNA